VASNSIPESNLTNKLRAISKSYGMEEDLLVNVAYCESGIRHDGVWGDDGLAYGLFQFHKPTFYKFAAEGMDYYSLDDQIEVAAWMFANDLESHWTCWRKLYI